MDGGEIVGVRYDGSEEVYADVVVDATGPAAPLAKKLDVTGLEREHQAIGIEYEFEGIDVNHPEFADLHDSMMLRLDHDLAPGGYSWIFPHRGRHREGRSLLHPERLTTTPTRRMGWASTTT